jgi:hypothetical protein
MEDIIRYLTIINNIFSFYGFSSKYPRLISDDKTCIVDIEMIDSKDNKVKYGVNISSDVDNVNITFNIVFNITTKKVLSIDF